MDKLIRETIVSVLAGEMDQYRAIVQTYEPDVYRLAAPVLGSRSAAEDVTQEAFVVAYRRLDSFDLDQPFRPWLMGIAANLVRNELRRRRRESSKLDLYSRYLDAVVQAEAKPNPRTEISSALAECRQELTGAAEEVIRGRYDEGLSLEVISDRLKRSLRATRQLLYRTRLSLRECIEVRLAAMEGASG